MAMKKRGRDPATLAMRRLVRRLEKAKIAHAVLGGMAVYAHGHERLTADVDVLLTPEGLTAFRERFVPRYYQSVPKRDRRYTDRTNGITVDLLVTGHAPGFGKPGSVRFPDPQEVREQIAEIYYVNLPTLIQLKLAARRHQNFADVVNLIRVHNLNEAFVNRLHPSLRQDFIECLEEKRRDEEYEERNG